MRINRKTSLLAKLINRITGKATDCSQPAWHIDYPTAGCRLLELWQLSHQKGTSETVPESLFYSCPCPVSDEWQRYVVWAWVTVFSRPDTQLSANFMFRSIPSIFSARLNLSGASWNVVRRCDSNVWTSALEEAGLIAIVRVSRWCNVGFVPCSKGPFAVESHCRLPLVIQSITHIFHATPTRMVRWESTGRRHSLVVLWRVPSRPRRPAD